MLGFFLLEALEFGEGSYSSFLASAAGAFRPSGANEGR